MSLNFEESRRIVDAAFAAAKEMGILVAIAVLDERGDKVMEARMDGAKWWWLDTCRGKAFATALFGQPSAELAERADSSIAQTMLAMYEGRLFFAQGALPIIKDGQMIGAVGVGGGTGQQDEDVARAGIAAL